MRMLGKYYGTVVLFLSVIISGYAAGEAMTMNSFELSNFRFDGVMGERIVANLENWLLRAPDANPGLLEMFYRRDRHLPYPTPIPWAGEFAGKYLISAVQALRITGDERLRGLLESFTATLMAAQDEDGYLGPWPKHERLLTHWDLWGHYHVLLGLLAWHDATSDPEALSCARRMGDYVCVVYPEGGRRPIEAGTPAMNLAMLHGMTTLYRLTGESRYLAMAQRFEEDLTEDGDWLNRGAAGAQYYELPGSGPRWESLHIVQGFVDLFRITGEQQYHDAAVNLWKSIRDHDRHPSGAFSTHEGATGTIYAEGAIETCCTVAWMALSVDILKLTGDSTVADELECSLWNQSLGAQHPSGSWCTYDTPMNGVRIPAFHHINFQYRPCTPELNCCSVNAPRSMGMLTDWAVLQEGDSVVLNYYGPSVFLLRRNNSKILGIRQETGYPVDGVVTITLEPETTSVFPLRLRIPGWSRHTEIRVNDEPAVATQEAGSYFTLERAWSAGDIITLTLDMTPRILTGRPPDRFGKAAVAAGPLLLACDAFYNEKELTELPEIETDNIELKRLPIQTPDRVGRFAPMGLWEIIGQGGNAMVLCDFASAGAHGTEYAAWLPAARPQPIPVELRAPENGVEGAPGAILFRWDAYSHTEITCRLLVARDPSFAQRVMDMPGLKRAYAVVADAFQQPGTYYWKVVAENAHGAIDNLGGARQFVVNPEAPQPFSAGMRGDEALLDAPMRGDAVPIFGALDEARGVTPAENRAGETDAALRFANGMARYRIPFLPETDYTAMAWIRPENLAAPGLQQVFSAWCRASDDPLRITIEGGNVYARIESHGGFSGTTGMPVREGEWTHLAAVKQGNTLTLYINGEAAAATGVPEKVNSASLEAAFGANPRYPGGEYFHGCISDAMFFARSLGAEEINLRITD